MKAPLLALAACFALGIALARPDPLVSHATIADPVRAVPMLLGCAATCLLAGLVILRARRQLAATVLAFAGFVFAGAAGMRLFEFRFPPGHVSHLGSYLGAGGFDLSQPVRLDGRLISDPQRTPYGSQFDVEATRLETEGPRNSQPALFVIPGELKIIVVVNLAHRDSSDPAKGSCLLGPSYA